MFKIRKRNLRKISVNVSVFLIFIFAAFAPVYAQEEAGQYNEYLKANESVKVSYSTHVQKKGWQAAVANGERAGTMGLNLRMEALRINVDNIKNYSGDIIYRSHIQTYGWEGEWKKNNEVSGTTGKGKRLEAIQIKLTKDLEKKYDIYYRVHAQTYGWLGWAKNGTSAGTVGCSKRIEAIEIVMVDKGGAAPGETHYSCIDNNIGISYSSHVQTFGWQGNKKNGDTSGTVGKSKRLEAVKINLLNSPYTGSIEYQTHIQTYGWEGQWASNGQLSGTEGKSKRLEAIRIRLTGELSEKLDVYYRVHCQRIGWMGWAKNGEEAGSSGFSYRLEGIEILLLPKGARTFSDETAFVSKDAQTEPADWDVAEVKTNLEKAESSVNIPIELKSVPAGTNSQSVNCYYTWKNNTTGEEGIIGDTLLGNSISWTPLVSGDYTITMTAADARQREVKKEISIKIIHGAINRGDAFFTAHMGLSSQAPNNSIPAFDLAGKAGFDSIEADVMETKDGVFVTSHDDNLSNICAVNVNISDLTYKELQDYNKYHISYGSNVGKYSYEELRIPTLEEYLDVCITYGCIPQLDIKCLKSIESVAQLYKILSDYGVQDRAIITSFDNLYLQTLRNMDPGIRLTYGVNSTQYVDVNWLKTNNVGVSVEYSKLLESKIYFDSDIDVNVYTVNDKAAAGILLEYGIDSITTNQILWDGVSL